VQAKSTLRKVCISLVGSARGLKVESSVTPLQNEISEVLRKRKMAAKELVKWKDISQMSQILSEESCDECEMTCHKSSKM
jgi:hypothetical protein